MQILYCTSSYNTHLSQSRHNFRNIITTITLPAYTRMCECGAFRSIAHRTSQCLHRCRSFIDVEASSTYLRRTGESSDRTSLELKTWKPWKSMRIFEKCRKESLKNDFFEDFSKISQRYDGFSAKAYEVSRSVGPIRLINCTL